MINSDNTVNPAYTKEEMDLISLRHLAKDARVISFDFFDTLFIRPLDEPEDAFDLLANKFSLPDFRQQRRKAQKNAFAQMVKEGRKEITLRNIYNNFQDSRGDIENIMGAEYQLELALVQPNPFFIGFFNDLIQSGKTVVITSDMYLEEEFFRAALKKYDMPQVPLYISATRNATKRDSGEIFDFLLAECEVEPRQVLHIGDNELADVIKPREKNIIAWHYHSPHLVNKGKKQPLASSLINGMMRTLQRENLTESSFQKLGYEYQAPATWGFLEWIRKESIVDNIDKLLFVSRDGYALERLASRYFKEKLPDFSYFMGSRIAFNLALMDEENFSQNLAFLMSGSDGLSPGELLERIGVEPPADNVMLSLGIPPDLIIAADNYELVEKFLIALRAEILKVCQRNRRGLFIYLNSLGIKEGDTLAMVDVGWSGTTQEAFIHTVKKFMNVNVIGYYFCIANTFERKRRTPHQVMKAFIDNDSTSPALVDKIYENRVAIELFFSAPHNTVIGYKPTKNGVCPVTDPGRTKSKDHNAINAQLTEGVDRFCEDFLAMVARLQVNLTPMQLAEPLISLTTKDDWRRHHLFMQIENFDSWGSTRNKVVKFQDYFKNTPQC
ncbi:HAD family hydrolase [Pantoea sp. NSTU24]|uniref:HAD family hydrolase n=1 Tax=Pantoea sp. NSTU24 TaxID=3391144 RepID=UPI003D07E2E5